MLGFIIFLIVFGVVLSTLGFLIFFPINAVLKDWDSFYRENRNSSIFTNYPEEDIHKLANK